MRAIWALVVVCFAAAGPRPAQASPRVAPTIAAAHHDAVIVSTRHAGSGAVRRSDRSHRADGGAPAIVPAAFALVAPPRIVTEDIVTPHAPILRARSFACSARGPPVA